MDRNMQIHNTGTRLDALRKKLAAREGTPGYEKNCEEIRKEIARLEKVTLRPASETTSTEDTTQSETATGATEPKRAGTGIENPES